MHRIENDCIVTADKETIQTILSDIADEIASLEEYSGRIKGRLFGAELCEPPSNEGGKAALPCYIVQLKTFRDRLNGVINMLSSIDRDL